MSDSAAGAVLARTWEQRGRVGGAQIASPTVGARLDPLLKSRLGHVADRLLLDPDLLLEAVPERGAHDAEPFDDEPRPRRWRPYSFKGATEELAAVRVAA